jgi:hypothetical protein
MKVKELIAQLQKLDPELSILGSCEESEIVEKGQLIRMFEIGSCDVMNVECFRDDSHKPRIRIMGAGEGERVVFVDLFTDF